MFNFHLNDIIFLLIFEFLLITIFALFGFSILVIVLLALFSLIIIYFSFNYPLLPLGMLLFSIFLDLPEILGTTDKGSFISILSIVFVYVIIFLAIKSLQGWNANHRFPKIGLLWLTFLFISALTIPNAINQTLALSVWRNFFAGFICFILAYYSLQKEKDIKILLTLLIIWGTTLALIELITLFQLGGIRTGIIRIFFQKNLIETSWGKSNYLAAFHVLMIPIAIGTLFLTSSKKIKLLLLSGIGIMLTGIIITLSRGAILSLAIGLLIFMLKVIDKKYILSVIFAIFSFIIVLLINPLTYVLFERLLIFEKSISYFSRIHFFEKVWDIFLNNPILGVGLGNLGYYTTYSDYQQLSAHNIILGLLGETGILGSLTFFTLIVYSIIIILRNYKSESNGNLKIFKFASLCGLLGVLIHSMMEPNLEGYQFSIIFWTFIALYLKLDLIKIPKLGEM